MAETRRYALTPQLDIEQILQEAQHRWLRPAEICEILRNYRKFRIAPEPQNMPPSGSLFLFDRKVLRYFRKDGHNWRKKKDGKTVNEAHERLKSGSIDVLHCYYAHGEENENFQRRSYWMLEEDFMHIVLVHYREVKPNFFSAAPPSRIEGDASLVEEQFTDAVIQRLKTKFDSINQKNDEILSQLKKLTAHLSASPGSKASYIRARDTEESAQVSHMESPSSSSSFRNQSQIPSQITDAGSPITSYTSEYEDAESDKYQANSGYHSFAEMQQYGVGPMTDICLSNSYVPMPLLNDQFEYQKLQTMRPESDFHSINQDDAARVFDEPGIGLTFSKSRTQSGLTSWEEVLEHCTTGLQSTPFDPTIASDLAVTLGNPEQCSLVPSGYFGDDLVLNQADVSIAQGNPVWQLVNAEGDSPVMSTLDVENNLSVGGNHAYASLLKQLSLELSNAEGGLKKYDSFSRWMSNELGEVDDSQLQSTSGVYWSTIESASVGDVSSMPNQEQLDSYLVSPSISQEQLFSIVDFSPSWAYKGQEMKILITGRFLKSKEDVEKCKWSCMFGEIEVPADILAEGTLCCYAPPHKLGRVPFYVTCSNRLACSEVREFEFRDQNTSCRENSDFHISVVNEMDLHVRLEKLLSMDSDEHLKSGFRITSDKQHLISEINSLMIEVDDQWFNTFTLQHERAFLPSSQNQLFEKSLKDKLHIWLLYKVAEDGKGPSVLDKQGQGVLHLAAALGYDWAITPTITAGVSINFRDVHGWTALHWAAFCGRERIVATLIELGANAGALTDPTPEFPTGRTPADLASSIGHKGIAAFVAESSLTSHLLSLTIRDSQRGDSAEVSRMTGIEDIVTQTAVQPVDGDPSLKDSLSAVRNAAQAASRIHQVFRVQSFHRKKLIEYSDNKYGISDERALSLISLKAAKPGQHDLPVHAAATRIQNKFRGWKGRKEFLVIRQRIVKIQAHVRGHQVRKHYKKIVWTVLVVEKAILRWRRKGSGLRGLRSEGMIEGPSVQNEPSNDDDYDFLKEGRKQTEVRLEKALARVKSMVQYPEARDQYRRLLNVVTELQESKDGVMNDAECRDVDLMTGLEELWNDDDTFMPAL